jgi:Protein of unknown function (DUF2490)
MLRITYRPVEMRLTIAFLFFLSFSAYSQHDFMVWTELGVKGKIVKKLGWTADINTRFGGEGVETFFPQVGINFKVKKWFKPSIEYRFIVDKNKYGNYKGSNRLNINASFKKEGVARFNLGFRVRYQYAFNRISGDSYDADFDQALRFKPSIEYDINNSVITPVVSAEFFYDPSYGPFGPDFSKMRMGIGAKLELDSPHGVSFKYQFDKKFHDYSANLRHVISLSYIYKI